MKVTVPVGKSGPAKLGATVTVKATAWPNVDGFGAAAVIVVVVNLMVDLSYGLLNPRIRLSGR